MLSQDREVPRVKAAIEAHLRGKLEPAGTAALKDLLEFTRPALVAECWCSGSQTLEQHLIVGQPMYVAGHNPSHFDKADDRVAHCVSGNSLTPGDYPVGVAFPAPHWDNPRQQGFFDLINLPTPRQQIAYSYYVKTDPAARLAKLSRRTLDGFLAEKKLLSDAELGMLGQLDAREVSRFANRYLLLVEDGMVDEDFNTEMSTSRSPLGSQSSRLGAICANWRSTARARPRQGSWRRSGRSDSCRPRRWVRIACNGWLPSPSHSAILGRRLMPGWPRISTTRRP